MYMITPRAQMLLGYIITRHCAPNARGGMFFLHFVRTTPELPWERRTLPQMTRYLELRTSFFALYTYARRFPKYHCASSLVCTPSILTNVHVGYTFDLLLLKPKM